MGNGGGCTSTFGNAAVVTSATGKATAIGGIGNGAIVLGDYSEATSAGFFSTAVTSGKYSNALAIGVGAVAVDLANDDNTGPSATSIGLFNKAINIGNGNTGRSRSAARCPSWT